MAQAAGRLAALIRPRYGRPMTGDAAKSARRSSGPDEGQIGEAGAATAAQGESERGDELPEDLDASGYVGPYVFPNNNRRRIPGYLYLGIAVALAVLWALTEGSDPVLVNDGMAAAAVGLALIGGYHLLAGWNLDVDERDALVVATRAVGFAVGHASAQMGWRGLRSRPTWRILVYSAESPPTRRGLVLIDGVDGEVVDFFVEDNPEDWSDLHDDLEGDSASP